MAKRKKRIAIVNREARHCDQLPSAKVLPEGSRRLSGAIKAFEICGAVKIATDYFASLKNPAEKLWESANEKL